jgi:putative FmdB family regulatory protein
MPIYEYRCNGCEQEFEQYVQTAQAAVACPACRSARVTRRLSVVGVRRLSGTFAAPGMSGDGGCCGGGGCGCH